MSTLTPLVVLLMSRVAFASPPDCNANAVADPLEFSLTPVLTREVLVAPPGFPLIASVTTSAVLPDASRVPFHANADPYTDMVVLNHVGPTGLTVYLGDEDGAFPDSFFIPIESAGHIVLAADLDNDGDHDILANTDTQLGEYPIQVFINDDSEFTRTDAIAEFMSATVIADFNADGFVDVAGDVANNVQVYVNNHDATFTLAATLAGADGFSYGNLGAGDVDADGDVDLVAAHGLGVRVYLNVNGAFPFFGDFAANEFAAADSVAVVDLDADGLPEIVTATNSSADSVRVLQNGGAGVFDPPAQLPIGPVRWLERADLDADADIDLVGVGGNFGSTALRSVRNLGDGTFASLVITTAGSFDVFPSLAPADFDMDGVYAVVSVEYDLDDPVPVVALYDNQPLPPLSQDCNTNLVPDECDLVPAVAFHDPLAFPTDVEPVWAQADARMPDNTLAPLDLDADTLPDIVTANENAESISILLNAGLAGPTWLGFEDHDDVPSVLQPVSIAAADFDADDDLDIAVGDVCNEPKGEVRVHFNDAAAGFPEFDAYMDAGTWIAAAELNGDAYVDIVSSYAVLVNKADAPGDFNPPQTIDSDLDDPAGVAAGDLDGDGDQDLVIAGTNDGLIAVLFNRGDATFGPPSTYAVDSPHAVAIADLDDDGFPDVAVANNEAGEPGIPGVAVLFNTGGGALGRPVGYHAAANLLTGDSPQVRFVVAADVDLDDDQDLVATARGGALVAILLNQGGGDFLPLVRRDLAPLPGRPAITDLDLDDIPDLALPIQSDDALWIVPGAGATSAVSDDDDGNGVPDECEACAADVNADGVLNILDFVAFQLAFVAGDPKADCDDNGVFNILDFVCFQQRFLAGCP